MKQKLSEEFINKLAEISAGYLPSDLFNKLIDLIEQEISNRFFDRTSESNFLRIISGRFDKISFLNDCIKYPNYIEILIAVSINSNYLTDILVRDPENFYWISNPSNLNAKIEIKKFPKLIIKLLDSYKSFNAKLNALKTLKRKELLRIGIKDILGISDLKETTEQLSILAKTITSELFEICYNEILTKNGIEKINGKYCIIALGKLGGNELNYSSDIDLIIFYDKNQKLKRKEYHEILTEAIYLFIESSSSITSSGFMYRVDFRLRPDGKTSPLCGSLASYLSYYESRGEDWERQMLIKASFVSGDKNLYKKFIDHLSPFIYPSSFSVSPVEQIKRLKSNVEKNQLDNENIKLQAGGIRDIEFSVQALQLINGGRFPEIRTGNTLTAIEKLFEKNLLTENEKETLRNSYISYRRIEHYLQLMNDKQTHIIPSKGELLKKLSTYLKFKKSADFLNEVSEKRREVRKIFNSVMGENKFVSKKENKLTSIKFENNKKAEKDLEFLSEGKGLLGQKHFDQNSIKAFIKIEDNLFEYLKTSLNPDLVLQNFVRFIKDSHLPSIWYKEFEDKNFFKAFLTICEFSQKAINLFAEDKDLREYFLTRKVFLKIKKEELYNSETKKILFILSVQFTLELISFGKVSKTLSDFFKIKIKNLTEELFDKHKTDFKYFIAAMGSFGTSEMTFSSDIDLIFVVDNIKNNIDLQKLFQNLLLKFKNEFKPFEVDCRLRPEGKNSPLVWEIESYKNYIKKRARTWEFQSFTKLNFISGEEKLFNSLINEIDAEIKYRKNDFKNDMIDMRKKLYPKDFSSLIKIFNIKKSSGGTTDIEFIVQLLLLSDIDLFKKLRGKRIASINSLIKNKKFEDIKILKENYIFLKNLELTNQNIFDSSTPVVKLDDSESSEKTNKILAVKMGFKSDKHLLMRLNEISKLNSSLFKKYFE